MPWSEDSKWTFWSSSQTATCPPVYHIRWKLLTVPFNIAELQAGNVWITISWIFIWPDWESNPSLPFQQRTLYPLDHWLENNAHPKSLLPTLGIAWCCLVVARPMFAISRHFFSAYRWVICLMLWNYWRFAHLIIFNFIATTPLAQPIFPGTLI